MRLASMIRNSDRLILRQVIICGLSLGLVASIVGCGGQRKADGASFETDPEKPIVITADSRNSNGTTIKAPWFSFRIKSTNNTDTVYTLLALSLSVLGIDKSGALKTTELGFVPSDFVVTLPIGMSGYTCVYSHFGEFAPRESKYLMLDGDSTETDPTNPSRSLKCLRTPLFMIGDNPSGPSGKSFIYTVRVKPLGWFGTYSDPTDRFETRFRFKTQ